MASAVYNVPRLLRSRIPRVCTVVVASTPDDMMAKIDGIVRDNPFLELRLDYLHNPQSVMPRLSKFLRERPEAILVATCRRSQNGGKFKGSVASQIEVLSKAAAAGCHLVDVEIETAEALKRGEFEKLRRNASTILSFHDFRSTRKLDDTFARMLQIPSDFYKVVSTATCLSDNVQMIKFLEKYAKDYSLVGFCMGEQGRISRVLSVRSGGLFTYGAVSSGEESAPGQLTTRELRSTYRIDHIDAATQIYGVAGDPVAHSLSPAMLNLAFRRENVNAVYLSLHTKNVDDLLMCVREIPIRGLSITMPHKEAIAEHLENADDLVKKTGACNTVVRAQDGKLYGFNTDVSGIVGPLADRLNLANSRILVLGAGGAARAAVFGLAGRGAQIHICNRTVPKAQKLARQAGAKVTKRTDLKKIDFDAIVNATSVGMGTGKQSPLEVDELRTRLVFDLVYNPIETKLIKMARAKGIACISGVEMFIRQGARQFEIWTGKPAPVEEMRGLILKVLQERYPREPESNGATPAPDKARPTEPQAAKSGVRDIKATASSSNGSRRAKPAKPTAHAPKSVARHTKGKKPLRKVAKKR